MNRKKITMIMAMTCCLFAGKAQSQVPVAAQWHFSGNNVTDLLAPPDNPSSIGGVDWVYCVLPTKNKGYIGCGYTSGVNDQINPVIFKLDNLGKLVWIKHITSATGPGLSYNDNEFGYLTQVIETPNGYAASGAAYLSGSRAVILLEVDEDGIYLHTPTLLLDNSYDEAFGRSLAIDHDATSDHSIYIAGNAKITTSLSGPKYQAFIYKVDYNTWSLAQSQDFGATYGAGPLDYGTNNIFFKIRTRQTSATTHELFTCGFKSGSIDDNITYNTDINGNPFQVSNEKILPNGYGGLFNSSVTVRDKDMWLMKLQSDFTVDYDNSFSKADLNYPASIHYTETGPYTARTITSTTNPYSILGGYTPASEYLKDEVNKDERAYDFTFTQDGNIAMVGLVNQIAPLNYLAGNGSKAVQGVSIGSSTSILGGFVDPVRHYYFDEYMDGDGYLLKINSSNGGLIYSKNVSHYSSKDFYPQIFQNGNGNFVISGSSSDYDTDYGQPEEYDALLLETEDNSTPGHLWRRAYHSEGKEDGMCAFTLAQTADGGFVLGGDNDEQHDNFSITKFAPYCSLKASFAIDERTHGGVYYLPNPVTTWPDNVVKNGDNIAAKVLVRKGETLTIQGITVNFASSDHMYDYFELGDDNKHIGKMMGIVVEPGGNLILDNAVLKGMDDCQSSADRYMWDGVVIMGNPKDKRKEGIQGNAKFVNATIQDARIGTLVDYASRNSFTVSQPANTISPDFESENNSSRYNANGNYGGGILNADYTLWQDCRFGVSYQQYKTSNIVINNFNYCKFISTVAGMADPCFYASEAGGRLPSSEQFGGWDVQYIFLRNSIIRTDPSFPPVLWGKGVASYDASIHSIACTYTNLKIGEDLVFSGTLARPVTSNLNRFDNVGNGIRVVNSLNGLTISGNTFFVPGNDIVPDPSGLILQTSTGYTVRTNTFDKATSYTNYPSYPTSSRGIQVSWGASWSNANNVISSNTFNNLRNPSMALQRNSNQIGDRGLQWKCNDYLLDNSRSISRISLLSTTPTAVAATMRNDQGYFDGVTNQPAENRFYTTCNNNNNVTSRERLYADNWVDQFINYYYDPSAPDYDPTLPCVTNSWYGLNSTNPVDSRLEYCNEGYGPQDPSDPEYPDDPAGLMTPGGNGATDAETALKRTMLVNRRVQYYSLKGDNASAAKLLEQDGRSDEALSFYSAAGMWENANRIWSKLPKGTEDEKNFAAINRKAIDLYSVGKTWKDLDASGQILIAKLAKENTRPGYMAAAVADFLGMRTFVWPAGVETEEGVTASKVNTNAVDGNHGIQGYIAMDKVQIYPNPTTGIFNIETMEPSMLYISNLQGQQIAAFAVTSGKASIKLSAGVAGGIYIGKLVGTESAKMSIVRIVYQP